MKTSVRLFSRVIIGKINFLTHLICKLINSNILPSQVVNLDSNKHQLQLLLLLFFTI